MTEYEKGYKDGMTGAALPNIIDNGDKIDGYAYSYKTDSNGVPHINIDCVRVILTKATDVQPVKHGQWENEYLDDDDVWWADCTNCKNDSHSRYGRVSIYAYCPYCGAKMINGDKQ